MIITQTNNLKDTPEKNKFTHNPEKKFLFNTTRNSLGSYSQHSADAFDRAVQEASVTLTGRLTATSCHGKQELDDSVLFLELWKRLYKYRPDECVTDSEII